MQTRWIVASLVMITACSDLTTPMDRADLKQISTGTDHSCAVVESGGIACWGSNDEGQLGVPGGPATRPVISHLAPLRIREIAAGNLASCARTTTNTVLCWGASNGPTAPEGLPALATISASSVGCGTTSGGEAWCWSLPAGRAIHVDGGPYRLVVAGIEQNCAVRVDSLATCWAQGGTTPTLVPGDHHFTALIVGRAHACGLDGDGSVWCWGANNRGQLGDNSVTARPTPVTLFAPGLPDPTFVKLAAGADHTCGILVTGAAYCWGRDDSGQSGNGGPPPTSNNYWSTPVAVSGGHTWSSLSGGANHTCGLTTDAVPYCWGSNTLGQLGTGDRNSSTSPLELAWNF